MIFGQKSRVTCTACGSSNLDEILSFGLQSLSTKFNSSEDLNKETEKYVLSIGYCKRCSTIQLVSRFPLKALQKKSPSIAFREPQKHLPEVVNKALALPGIDKSSRFLGLSYIDEDLLKRMAEIGYSNIDFVDYSASSNWRKGFGLETMQALISDHDFVSHFSEYEGYYDLVSARFILEHAESALCFLKNLFRVVVHGGYVLLEVPDCRKMFDAENHALIWEDHFTYFTLETLKDLIARAGGFLISIDQYPYDYEDTLTAIIKVNDADHVEDIVITQNRSEAVKQKLITFSEGFREKKTRLQSEFHQLLDRGEKLALFGAGHHAAKFVNFYCVNDLFEFVVDDNPQKEGLFLPGSYLQIRSSKWLLQSSVSTCISTLGPETESKVRRIIPEYFDHGGTFIPAFNIVG